MFLMKADVHVPTVYDLLGHKNKKLDDRMAKH